MLSEFGFKSTFPYEWETVYIETKDSLPTVNMDIADNFVKISWCSDVTVIFAKEEFRATLAALSVGLPPTPLTGYVKTLSLTVLDKIFVCDPMLGEEGYVLMEKRSGVNIGIMFSQMLLLLEILNAE